MTQRTLSRGPQSPAREAALRPFQRFTVTGARVVAEQQFEVTGVVARRNVVVLADLSGFGKVSLSDEGATRTLNKTELLDLQGVLFDHARLLGAMPPGVRGVRVAIAEAITGPVQRLAIKLRTAAVLDANIQSLRGRSDQGFTVALLLDTTATPQLTLTHHMAVAVRARVPLKQELEAILEAVAQVGSLDSADGRVCEAVRAQAAEQLRALVAN